MNKDSIERDFSLMEKVRELEDALCMTIKINHGQVLEVTVADLISKYKSCLSRNDTKYIDAFTLVLKYYLTEEEFLRATKD